MMSLSPGMSAGHAGGCFSKEDYYLHGDDLDENSLWFGKGSRELGLEGPVREEELCALCRGEDPAGNRLVSPKVSRDMDSGALIEQHRAGNDCTFSASKSVSIARLGGRGAGSVPDRVRRKFHDLALVEEPSCPS